NQLGKPSKNYLEVTDLPTILEGERYWSPRLGIFCADFALADSLARARNAGFDRWGVLLK
ncbi:MAG: hypothetical protein VB855_01370, partial [Pirellulaceae bacterium]